MKGTERSAPQNPRLLGGLLAGGRSSRYGRPKAAVTVGGVPLARRGADALSAVADRVVILGGDPALAADLTLEHRADVIEARGPLTGVVTGLLCASHAGLDGVVILACDLPLVSGELLALLVRRWDGVRVVTPASMGPLGIEPLVAVYPVAALPALEDALRGGVRSMHEALSGVATHTVPTDVVATCGDPASLFLNVNRPSDRERAERALARGGGRST